MCPPAKVRMHGRGQTVSSSPNCRLQAPTHAKGLTSRRLGIHFGMTLKQALDSLESASILDGPGDAIHGVLEPALADSAVGAALHGRWIGHPIHPALVNVTIGSWTSAVVLDLIDHQSRAAKLVTAVGLVSAPAAIATGWADWSTLNTRQRRVGMIHAASNATGVFLFLGSYLRRRKQTDRVAKALAAAGLASASIGGLIGGHLAYSTSGNDAAPAGKHSVEAIGSDPARR